MNREVSKISKSQDKHREIIALGMTGEHTTMQIGAIVGLERGLVGRILTSYGLSKSARYQIRDQKICEVWREGNVSLDALGASFGLAGTTVKNIVQAGGLSVRPKRRLSNDQIKRMNATGRYNVPDLMKLAGASHSTIERIIRDQIIPVGAELECVACGAGFTKTQFRQKYCLECGPTRNKRRPRRLVMIRCGYCGAVVKRQKHFGRQNERAFCSSAHWYRYKTWLLSARNNDIRRERKEGKKLVTIAKERGLSPGHVGRICCAPIAVVDMPPAVRFATGGLRTTRGKTHIMRSVRAARVETE